MYRANLYVQFVCVPYAKSHYEIVFIHQKLTLEHLVSKPIVVLRFQGKCRLQSIFTVKIHKGRML